MIKLRNDKRSFSYNDTNDDKIHSNLRWATRRWPWYKTIRHAWHARTSVPAPLLTDCELSVPFRTQTWKLAGGQFTELQMFSTTLLNCSGWSAYTWCEASFTSCTRTQEKKKKEKSVSNSFPTTQSTTMNWLTLSKSWKQFCRPLIG